MTEGVTLGSTTTATAGTENLEYVIYALGPYDELTQPRFLLMDMLGCSGEVWVGFSNYTTGTWEWHNLVQPASANMWVRLPRDQAFRDSDSMIFCIFAVYSGSTLSFSGGHFVPDPPFGFTAQYDWIVSEDDIGEGNIDKCIISGNGQKVFTINFVEGAGLVHSMDVDGSNIQSVALPSEVKGVLGWAVNHDGSRLFVTHEGQAIYKVEGETVTKLWVFDGTNYLVAAPLQCDAAGDYVYFGNHHGFGASDKDIWRVEHDDGTKLELLVDDDDITHASVPTATALTLGYPTVSADGGIVAFHAKFTGDVNSEELFVIDGGEIRQVTDYADSSDVVPRAVSGDGSTIVFTRTGWEGPDTLYAVAPDGTGTMDLGYFGHNYGGGGVNYDGSMFFFADMNNGNGVLVDTATPARYTLATEAPIYLGASGPISMSSDGSTLCFRREFDTVMGVHVVHLNDPVAVPGVPQIEWVLFSPPQYVRTYPDLGVVVEAMVSDPSGLGTVTAFGLTEIIDGLFINPNENGPTFWELDMNDDGEFYDYAAGDGVYTSFPGSPGMLINESNQITVRIGVMDEDGNASIADTVLAVIGEPAAE